MSLPDSVLHTFSQKCKLVFLCFLRVIHQRHETSASAVQIGSGALKQMAETKAIRRASIIQALRQCSKSIYSIPQKACAANLYCLPSFILCNPCQIPQKRGPARAKRSGQTHETARSSGPFADSIEEVVSYGRPLSVEGRKTSVCRLFWNRTVFTMAHPSFGSRCPESAEFSRHGRKSPTAQSLQGMERVKQDRPGKPRRHHADACTILGHYTGRHCQPMLRFDICACPSPVMISCSE